jgi:hypothetical protein
VLRLPRITPLDMQRHTRARVAEFRRLNHIRGPEANSKTFTTIMSAGHRLSLPEGGGLKQQIAQQELKLAAQYFSLLQVLEKTYDDVDASDHKFISDVQHMWSQDFAEMIRQVKRAVLLLRSARERRDARAQSIGAIANATRRQQDTMVSRCKHSSSTLAAGSDALDEPVSRFHRVNRFPVRLVALCANGARVC